MIGWLKWAVSKNYYLTWNSYLDLQNAYSAAEMVDNKHRWEKYYQYKQSQLNRMWVQRADPDEKSSLLLKTAWLDDCTNSYKARKKKKKYHLQLSVRFLL